MVDTASGRMKIRSGEHRRWESRQWGSVFHQDHWDFSPRLRSPYLLSTLDKRPFAGLSSFPLRSILDTQLGPNKGCLRALMAV